jgi:hypothetical protein
MPSTQPSTAAANSKDLVATAFDAASSCTGTAPEPAFTLADLEIPFTGASWTSEGGSTGGGTTTPSVRPEKPLRV